VSKGEWEGFVARVVDVIRARGLVERVLLSSFATEVLVEARRIAPEIRRGVLFDGRRQRNRRAEDLIREVLASSMHLEKDEVDQEWVEACHGMGCPVFVYTVNDSEEAERLRRMGVDGVFTDRPDLVRRGGGAAT
jgi:glycerophosphoryl diester phosphodiesterase